MINIYDYSSPAEFLKDYWLKKKATNSNFSFRLWARQLNLPHHSVLYEITVKRRNIPKALIPLFAKNLKLDSNQTNYFEVMVDLQRSKCENQRGYYIKKLDKLRGKQNIQFHHVDECSFVEDPLHLMILELTSLKNFKSCPKWIKSHLRIERSEKEIQRAIRTLIKLELLTKNNQGTLLKTQKHLSTKNDIPNSSVKKYHQAILNIASNQVIEQDVDTREYSSFMMNIKKESIPKAKELIRDFIRDFMNEIEASTYLGDETYNIGVQFYSLSNSEEI